MPIINDLFNTQMENVVDLLRLHSRRFSRHRVALFSEVLELHKSKVYGFSYLDFCTTRIYKENRFFVSSSFPHCSIEAFQSSVFTEEETSFTAIEFDTFD